MPTVQWDEREGAYVVTRRGTFVSRHRKASAAKRAGKKQGRKYGEPVSYKGKNMNTTKWIYRPDPEEQFSGGEYGTPSSRSKSKGKDLWDKLF